MPKQATAHEPLWGTPQTSAYLGVPEATLLQWVSRGEGPRSYRVGRYRKWKPSDVLAWLETRASDTGGKPAA